MLSHKNTPAHLRLVLGNSTSSKKSAFRRLLRPAHRQHRIRVRFPLFGRGSRWCWGSDPGSIGEEGQEMDVEAALHELRGLRPATDSETGDVTRRGGDWTQAEVHDGAVP